MNGRHCLVEALSDLWKRIDIPSLAMPESLPGLTVWMPSRTLWRSAQRTFSALLAPKGQGNSCWCYLFVLAKRPTVVIWEPEYVTVRLSGCCSPSSGKVSDVVCAGQAGFPDTMNQEALSNESHDWIAAEALEAGEVFWDRQCITGAATTANHWSHFGKRTFPVISVKSPWKLQTKSQDTRKHKVNRKMRTQLPYINYSCFFVKVQLTWPKTKNTKLFLEATSRSGWWPLPGSAWKYRCVEEKPLRPLLNVCKWQKQGVNCKTTIWPVCSAELPQTTCSYVQPISVDEAATAPFRLRAMVWASQNALTLGNKRELVMWCNLPSAHSFCR